MPPPPCGHFHETNKYSPTLYANLIYRISPSSEINSFTLLNKVWFPVRRYLRKSRLLNKCFADKSCKEFYLNQTRKVTNTGKSSFTSRSKVWLSLCRFSADSNLRNNIAWESPKPTSIKIGEKCRPYGQTFQYVLKQNVACFHCINF
jgi:hypothetical protein